MALSLGALALPAHLAAGAKIICKTLHRRQPRASLVKETCSSHARGSEHPGLEPVLLLPNQQAQGSLDPKLCRAVPLPVHGAGHLHATYLGGGAESKVCCVLSREKAMQSWTRPWGA